jgi:hypothetical protein
MSNDRPQHHAQPGERGQGGDGIPADDARTPAPQGGLGGQSGTGQATPHHGLQQPGGEAALNPPVGGAMPTPDNGATYQSGGTQQDRAQKDSERKADENTSGSPSNNSGAADPAPGSQGGQNP